jgi:hypothetical protein
MHDFKDLYVHDCSNTQVSCCPAACSTPEHTPSGLHITAVAVNRFQHLPLPVPSQHVPRYASPSFIFVIYIY